MGDSTKMWVEDLRLGHDHLAQAVRNPFVQQAESFETTAGFLEKLGQQFGAFQNLECVELKNVLMDMDHHGSGRVLLRDFYSGFKQAGWMFTESLEYLHLVSMQCVAPTSARVSCAMWSVTLRLPVHLHSALRRSSRSCPLTRWTLLGICRRLSTAVCRRSQTFTAVWFHCMGVCSHSGRITPTLGSAHSHMCLAQRHR